ncbi:hypothetical protein ACFL9T_01025 [Thermodesulfobacteriota bacterium]
MRVSRKILLAFVTIGLVLILSLAGLGIYLYSHPEVIKSFIQKSIATATGASCTINNLSFSLKPLLIQSAGLSLIRIEGDEGYDLKIKSLRAEMKLQGAFGQRRLLINNLTIEGFSLNINKAIPLPEAGPKAGESSFFREILHKIIAFFLFQDIKFHRAELKEGELTALLNDQEVEVQKIHLRVGPDKRVDVSGSMLMHWPARGMRLQAPLVEITAENSLSLRRPEIIGRLISREMNLEGPLVRAGKMEIQTDFNYSHNLGKILFESMSLHLERLRMKEEVGEKPTPHIYEAHIRQMDIKSSFTYDFNTKSLSFTPLAMIIEGMALQSPFVRTTTPVTLKLSTRGNLQLDKDLLETADLVLNVKDVMNIKGKLKVGYGRQAKVGMQVEGARFFPARINELLANGIKQHLTPYQLDGAVTLKGGIDGIREEGKWLWQCKLRTDFAKNAYALSLGQTQLAGHLDGEILCEGRFPDIKMAARLVGEETTLMLDNLRLDPFNVRFSLEGGLSSFSLRDLEIHLPTASLRAGEEDILIKDIFLNSPEGHIHVDKKTLNFPEIRLDTALVKNLVLSLNVAERKKIIGLKGDAVRLIQSAQDLNLLPVDWQATGRDSIKIRLTSQNKDDWSISSRIELQNFALQNPDGRIMGEKMALEAGVEGRLNLQRAEFEVQTTIGLKQGEILVDRFYMDLNLNPFLLAFKGTYNLHEKSLTASSIRAGFRGILNVEGQCRGYLKPQQRYEISFKIPETPLNPFFHHFIQEPFAMENPALEKLKVGGNVSGDFSLTLDQENWALKGRCLWHGGEVSSRAETFSFKGIDLNLPVRLRTDEGEGQWSMIPGKLAVRSITLPHLPEQSLTIPLDAGINQLAVRTPTTIMLPGGSVQIGPVTLHHILDQFSIETSLTLAPLELEPLLAKIWSRPIEGVLEGRLESITYQQNDIRTSGELKMDIFGGEILISELGASGLLTSAPVYRFDARGDHLQLAEMTTDTAFGKIEGVLQGYIKDCEIADGQPQRFNLLLETIEKKGVPQRISIKAVDNIAQIGGGQSPFMGLAGVFTSFFRQFPYEKIGVRALLENDVFRINGTIKEGDTEYLVKRGGFSGVNIVNQNPDNRTSFKDMVKRIKRVTASESGPVVR